MTIYLLLQGRSYVAKVLTYVLAVFASYLVLGVVLMLGYGFIWGYLDGPGTYVVQGAAGALLLGYALLAPEKPRGESGAWMPRSPGLAAVFLLGVTITVVEFSTAFPYLGAIVILTNAELAVAWWMPILVVYNAIFVSPPLLLMAAYGAFGARLKAWFERLRYRFEDRSREIMLWAVGIVGFLLLADSLAFFDYFGLVG